MRSVTQIQGEGQDPRIGTVDELADFTVARGHELGIDPADLAATVRAEVARRTSRPAVVVNACAQCGEDASALYRRVEHPVTHERVLCCSEQCADTYTDAAPTTRRSVA